MPKPQPLLRRRAEFIVFAASLAALDLVAKSGLSRMLPSGERVDLRIIELRVVYNPGVAFSLGSQLPSWLILGITGVLTAILAGYAWQV